MNSPSGPKRGGTMVQDWSAPQANPHANPHAAPSHASGVATAATPAGTGTGSGPRAVPEAFAATAMEVHYGNANPIGHLIAGKYRISRLVGEGGMGAVYEGEHVELGKRIAVKLVHGDHGRRPEVGERFKREARATSAVESDHIVQVFDVGFDPDLGLFMVMEFLRGKDLGSVLETNGPMEPRIACALVAQAAAGLEAAHAAGIVHRDLKPPNVFLVTRGDGSTLVKLVDFGVAKLVRDAAEGQVGLTRMGSALGTPQYMSPEQAQGLPSVDLRTDIYALGLVLYECLVGQPAYPLLSTYEQMIVQLITMPQPRVRDRRGDVPPELDRLVGEMMAHPPDQRPQTMTQVLERLLAIYPDLAEMRLVVPGMEGDPMRASRGRASQFGGSFGGNSGARRSVTSSPFPSQPSQPSLPTTPMATAGTVDHGSDEHVDDVAGVPRKGGAAKWIALGVLGICALASGALVAVKVTGKSAPPPAPAPAASVAAPVTPPVASAPPANTAAPVVAPVVAPAASTPTVSPAPPAPAAKGAAVAKGGAPPAGKGAPPPPAGAKPPPPPAGGKVGAAGVAEQF